MTNDVLLSKGHPSRARRGENGTTESAREAGAAVGAFFAPPAPPPTAIKEKPPREKKPKAKNDPKLVSAARELRDRYLEQVNGGAFVLETEGRYEVARALPADPAAVWPNRLLPAA